MIWRLKALEDRGFEGTIIGTLIMPYCSGISNLIFAFVMGKNSGSGAAVFENCMVNNVTNLTLLLGLPAIIFSLTVRVKAKNRRIKTKQNEELNFLSLLFTIIALIFFSGILWGLGSDGLIDKKDGFILIAIFIFWQILHIFEVLKSNVHNRRKISFTVIFDLLFLLVCAWLIFYSVDHLVLSVFAYQSKLPFLQKLGWLSGFLMVLPNALLAFYYAKNRRADIVYASQIGDAHICIPMCVGLFAIFSPITVPASFSLGLYIILGTGLVHFFCLLFFGRLPKVISILLVLSYIYFLVQGFIS